MNNNQRDGSTDLNATKFKLKRCIGQMHQNTSIVHRRCPRPNISKPRYPDSGVLLYIVMVGTLPGDIPCTQPLLADMKVEVIVADSHGWYCRAQQFTLYVSPSRNKISALECNDIKICRFVEAVPCVVHPVVI